jgi:L-cystine uptake protein TcyP (sodium:dicarboxylate symporter family)
MVVYRLIYLAVCVVYISSRISGMGEASGHASSYLPVVTTPVHLCFILLVINPFIELTGNVT